jgi:sterol desaturase/sphingolipid hydroxylase (fatty acid hydroxylase superfamily)
MVSTLRIGSDSVNYGNELLPLDKWFGTFHDGSENARKTMKQRATKEGGVDAHQR